MRGTTCRAIAILMFLAACGGGGGGASADLDAVEVGDVLEAVAGDGVEVAPDVPPRTPVPLREMLGGVVLEKVRFVVDASLEGVVEEENLKQMVLSHSLREADPYGVLTAADKWWEDYQDQAEILYYSAEHVFSDESPYPGAVFMPHVWPDVTVRVSDVVIEYADLSGLYDEVAKRAVTVTDPTDTAWTLLSAADGIRWAREQYAHAPDEMVVLVTNNPVQREKPSSFYFVEEEYAQRRGFAAHYFNTPFDQWPTAMQEAEGLRPHDLPIWMHFAFLNGEWDPDAGKWRLFPNTRWGGYDGDNLYFIEFARDATLARHECAVLPRNPPTHFYLDEQEFKKCLSPTQRLHYDWHRLWRHAFNVPSIPFWWSEKVDIRVVVVDLREYDDGKPEYDEDAVIDWRTFEDSVRAANPFANITIQRYPYRPPDDIRAVLLKHFVQEADFPLHSDVRLLRADGSWKTFHMDWHHHWDIPGLPGMQVVLADRLREYWGGADPDGKPLQYDPFAPPYHRSGRAFVMPAIFFLTPYRAYEGRLGGWTANTGQLMCVFARQFGLTCEQVMDLMEQKFGGPVGPNLNAWSDAYGLWWEVFLMDWTYTTSPVPTLRFLLDPAPFHDLLKSVPDLGELLDTVAPMLFAQLFGRFHPWATGFPFWLRESLDNPDARELTRQFTSYQFAESLQHNMGYKHQTTVIPDAPYLGMEDGYDYRKHQDLAETFEMTTEQATIPFYSTEPGSRDFPVDANSYMTFKMGAGTQHMLKRVFARREVVALYDLLAEADATFTDADPDFREAVRSYLDAGDAAVAWQHEEAYRKALQGLSALDRYFTARGEPDRLHTDWDAPSSFTPSAEGMPVTAEQLDKDLKVFTGR